MICKNCGNEFDEGIFCPECGTRIPEAFTDIDPSKAATKDVLNQNESEELTHPKEDNEFNTKTSTPDQERIIKEKKTGKKAFSLLCLILAIATYPLVVTLVLWFPSIMASIAFGIIAYHRKEEPKGLYIAGFIIDALFILIAIYACVFR